MKSVAEHYADHLAPIYVWMAGGAEAALAAGESELEAVGLPGGRGDSVLDLGAGFGAHSIPLARWGVQVTAVDKSAAMLAELARLAGGLPIRTVNADLVEFLREDRGIYNAILCMGDTLTHLSSHGEVNELIALAVGALAPAGRLIFTFRDYTAALCDEERFIPVKADDDRILTCFLEFDEITLAVHDIVHERKQGSWTTCVSAYRKLRIGAATLEASMQEHGLHVQREAGPRGMVRMVATKTQVSSKPAGSTAGKLDHFMTGRHPS